MRILNHLSQLITEIRISRKIRRLFFCVLIYYRIVLKQGLFPWVFESKIEEFLEPYSQSDPPMKERHP